MPSIHVIYSDGRIADFPILKEEITIGRSKDNDIVLNDSTVSRNHARIINAKKDYLLVDLGSFNGTQLNGESVQNAVLNHKDTVKIGLTKLTFLTKAEKEPSLTESLVLVPES